GGGGKGIRVAWNRKDVEEGFPAVRAEAKASFGDDRIFIEKFIESPRHIEIQVLGDKHGHVVHLFERECSIQRRNQKVIEEAPSPLLDEATRKAMGDQAVALAKAVGYDSAGTVEFVAGQDRSFFFLEMNTRLQVEHPVTELITGVDLVEQMIRVAAGEPLPFAQADLKIDGWAVESRIYAEDPYRGFLPSIGRLTRYRPPQEFASQAEVVRNDTGVAEGGEISMHYDPMIAKLCTWAPDRERAVDAMERALDGFELEGIGHNLPFLSAVMAHPKFRSGEIHTGFIAEEWPEGFSGVDLPRDTLRRIAAACATLQRIEEIRRARISGRIDHHERRVGEAFVVQVAGESHAVALKAGEGATDVRFEDGAVLRVAGDWTPGARLARLTVEGTDTVLKVEPRIAGFRVRHRGADLDVKVWTARQAELAALMPEKQAADTSKLLLCPMPGVVVHVAVEEGQEVEEGQPLCTVEAMKMENVLRAERKLKVAKLHAAAGDSLSVDQTIMEFE
ncbi:MAG: ATP-binding protein, partial [Paracoccus sp. (in: a-proteobacteria)]|uniref:ATP-binding protein n=1 Tax=Paracoccus sp. TaxID=267 RepID=UPI0040582964